MRPLQTVTPSDSPAPGPAATPPASLAVVAPRLGVYLAERFQPPLVLVKAIMYAAALVYGIAVAQDGPLHVGALQIVGVIGIVAYFLVARVFDEHKDYEFDVEYLPDRPLPRGAISWREVDGLGVAAAIVQVVVCVAIDGGVGPVCAVWAVAFAYLVLTRYEFFVRPWLRRHFVVNTVTHLPVYALVSVWAAQIGAAPEWIGGGVVWLALYIYVHTFGLDLWRKSHGPEDERDGVDSYTQIWGTTAAALATAATVVLAAALAAVMLIAADATSWVGFAALVVVSIPVLVALVPFARAPSRATNGRKRDLLAFGLVGLHLTIAVSILVERGLA